MEKWLEENGVFDDEEGRLHYSVKRGNGDGEARKGERDFWEEM